MNYTIHNGNSAEVLAQYADNTFDSIVTDPPYLIGFLGKEWDDADNKQLNVYQECLRVLKPGGYILAFSAARTYHHLAITLEQAGFEVRDQLMWLYASGFPKSQDIGKAIEKRNLNGSNWAGWKTALKPAHEPICMARKPIKGSCIDNVLTHGTGALNIDATRIDATDKAVFPVGDYTTDTTVGSIRPTQRNADEHTNSRYPSNVLGEVEGYQKFFYHPKVSRKERHCGHTMPEAMFGQNKGCYDENGQRYAVELDKREGEVGNNHPTVKPVALMTYLIKLVTPPKGTVLDPFTGSGSTGMAAVALGHTFIGCELDPAYVDIANKRITAWNTPDNDNFNKLFE